MGEGRLEALEAVVTLLAFGMLLVILLARWGWKRLRC